MKRILIAMLAAVVACGFSGCVNESNIENNTSINQSENEAAIETTYKLADDFSEDFHTFRYYGIDISIPCKFSDIDERLTMEIIKPEQTINGKGWINLYFLDEYVGSMRGINEDFNFETDELKFLEINFFNIKGLDENSKKEDVQKVFGAGNHIDSEYYDAYYTGDMMITFEYYREKTAITVAIYE